MNRPHIIDAEVVNEHQEYRFTEAEAARRFGDIIRACARFAADEGIWYFYDGARWVKDHGGVWMLKRSLEVSRAYAEDAVRFGSSDPNFQARVSQAKIFNGLAGRKRLIELAKAEPGLAILSPQFDADPWLFNVLNGTINLKTGELQPHKPTDLVTKLAPVEYDQAAQCPRFERFLQEVIGDAETISWLPKAIGHSATGICSERAAFFLYGPQGGGKSLLVETTQAVLGDYAVLAPTSLLIEKQGETHPCDRMVLKGVRFAAFPELPRGKRFDLPTFKTLTGNDTLTGRGMRENFSTFKPTAKLWMTGNNKPVVSDPDNSTWVRMRVIPVEKSIPDELQDKGLPQKLLLESPGILAWIVRGALAWQREGLGQPARVRAATAVYKEESDRLAPFLAERCTSGSDCRVSRAALRAAYAAWCETEDERLLSPRDFAEQLRQHGVTDGKVHQAGQTVRGWHRVGLVDAERRDTRDTSGHQFSVSENNSFSYKPNRESVSRSVLVTRSAPHALDPLAALDNCLRAKPGSTASDTEKAELATFFSGLNGQAEATVERLWSYWKSDPAPTVAAFMANERHQHPRAS